MLAFENGASMYSTKRLKFDLATDVMMVSKGKGKGTGTGKGGHDSQVMNLNDLFGFNVGVFLMGFVIYYSVMLRSLFYYASILFLKDFNLYFFVIIFRFFCLFLCCINR